MGRFKKGNRAFQRNEDVYVNKNCFLVGSLKVYLNIENNNNIYNANSTISINNYKKINLISKKDEIIIRRDETLIDFPLSNIENGFLILGEKNMEGKL